MAEAILGSVMKNYKAEEIVSSNLHAILRVLTIGESIEESERLQEVLSGLEFILPAIFQDKYKEWKCESLDGIYLAKASKTGENEAEFIGLCILITDQTLTPFHLRLRVVNSQAEIGWLRCRLGENTQQGLLKIPYNSLSWHKYLHKLEDCLPDSMDWVYEVEID